MLSPDRIPNRVELFPRGSISDALRLHAFDCERRFGIEFCAFAYFPAPLLTLLHTPEQNTKHGEPSENHMVSESESEEFGLLSAIANKPTLTQADRHAYLNSLLAAYRRMPLSSGGSDNAVTVAPRREGMLLARELGLLRGRFYTPHLKRIPVANELAVGIEFIPSMPPGSQVCRIVDGAMASGVTVITLMEALSQAVSEFEVYTVHCTPASISAMRRYGKILERKVSVCASCVSGVLNRKFYAVSAENAFRLCIGDVGDVIAPLFPEIA